MVHKKDKINPRRPTGEPKLLLNYVLRQKKRKRKTCRPPPDFMAFGGFRTHKISGVAVDPETVGLQFREIESKVVLLHLRLLAPDLLFITVLPEMQRIISPFGSGDIYSAGDNTAYPRDRWVRLPTYLLTGHIFE